MEDKPALERLVYVVVLAFLVFLGVVLWMNKGVGPTPYISKTTYTCAEEKVIQATFYEHEVRLVLNNGKKLTLPQTISASGIRYATSDESFVFWSKGNTAFVTEGNPNVQTYSNCVTAGEVPGGIKGWETYAKPLSNYAIQYPQTYTINPTYLYTQLGPGKEIKGVKFTIPQSVALGTNLSSDSGISVEEVSGASSCAASRFLYDVTNHRMVSENGIDYSVGEAGGAAAGNLYEERVYAIPGTSPCLAVRYFIHSTNIGNYEPGTVREFDRAALLKEFDAIRRTLKLE